MVHAYRDTRVLERRAERGNERRNLRRNRRKLCVFDSLLREVRRRRQRITSILCDGNERIDQRAVESLVSLVRNEEHRVALRAPRKRRPTTREARDVFL